jgi:AraC-like DNA-binding protein
VLPVLAARTGQPGDDLVAGLRNCALTTDRVEFANPRLGLALHNPARNEQRLKLLLDATNGGRCRSADIANALSMSNRSFTRLWNDIVGIQPRRFLQLMRFHGALARIAAGEDLAVIAANCGYSDQAHMARQIKQIAGLPPSSLRRRLDERAYRALYESRPGAPWLEQRNVSAP